MPFRNTHHAVLNTKLIGFVFSTLCPIMPPRCHSALDAESSASHFGFPGNGRQLASIGFVLSQPRMAILCIILSDISSSVHLTICQIGFVSSKCLFAIRITQYSIRNRLALFFQIAWLPQSHQATKADKKGLIPSTLCLCHSDPVSRLSAIRYLLLYSMFSLTQH